ncbi:MAG: hypothetical protein AAF206_19715 [Bacteroidota bacterium]
MKKSVHTAYIGVMVLTTIAVTVYLIYTGYSYYRLPLEERFYHDKYHWFNPSGLLGYGLGIAGTLMMLVGVALYIARKRYNFLGRLIRLKYLLEFHIFLCTLGPILILFHTSFKFGGIVSIAFWCMVAVVLSGVIGRFIYIQIPHSIEGRALSLGEVQALKNSLIGELREKFAGDETLMGIADEMARDDEVAANRATVRRISQALMKKNIPVEERQSIVKLVKNEVSLSRKITRLDTMLKLFRYWHVVHLPFALVMLVIAIVHIGVTLTY